MGKKKLPRMRIDITITPLSRDPRLPAPLTWAYEGRGNALRAAGQAFKSASRQWHLLRRFR